MILLIDGMAARREADGDVSASLRREDAEMRRARAVEEVQYACDELGDSVAAYGCDARSRLRSASCCLLRLFNELPTPASGRSSRMRQIWTAQRGRRRLPWHSVCVRRCE